MIPHSLKQRVLTLNHYPVLAGHPGGRKLYYHIKRHFYWPALAVDCYATVRNCPACAKEQIKLRKKVGEPKLFPTNGPLKSVCIDILGELIRTQRGHKYFLVITDRFTKLVKVKPLREISAADVARAFVTDWVFNYGPPRDLISDNGQQFTSKFFQEVCRILNVQNAFTTTYHPQTNGQVERFNRITLSSLRAYILEHPRDWDLYAPALTYAYNFQPQTSTALAPFELVLSKPPGPLVVQASNTEPSSTLSFKHKWKLWLQKSIAEVKTRMDQAQERYKRNYIERLRRDVQTVKADDWVYLRVERKDQTQMQHKLTPIPEGPFRVKDADTTAKTVIIERYDNTVENVSRARVTLAPRPPDPVRLHNIT